MGGQLVCLGLDRVVDCLGGYLGRDTISDREVNGRMMMDDATALAGIGLTPAPISEQETMKQLADTWRGRLQELIPRRDWLIKELDLVCKTIEHGLKEVDEIEQELYPSVAD